MRGERDKVSKRGSDGGPEREQRVREGARKGEMHAHTRMHARTDMHARARAHTQVTRALSSFEWAKVWYWPCFMAALDAGDVVFIGACVCVRACTRMHVREREREREREKEREREGEREGGRERERELVGAWVCARPCVRAWNRGKIRVEIGAIVLALSYVHECRTHTAHAGVFSLHPVTTITASGHTLHPPQNLSGADLVAEVRVCAPLPFSPSSPLRYTRGKQQQPSHNARHAMRDAISFSCVSLAPLCTCSAGTPPSIPVL